MNRPSMPDPPKKLRGRALTQHQIDNQRKWIDWCENNGRSYAGPNGNNIRLADREALTRLERKLAEQP